MAFSLWEQCRTGLLLGAACLLEYAACHPHGSRLETKPLEESGGRASAQPTIMRLPQQKTPASQKLRYRLLPTLPELWFICRGHTRFIPRMMTWPAIKELLPICSLSLSRLLPGRLHSSLLLPAVAPIYIGP